MWIDIKKKTNKLFSLSFKVRDLVEECSCPTQFPMIRVSEGKYRIGDTKILIFVRILRSHVMVRVGGGWDTLSHYLDKHDPCRCRTCKYRAFYRAPTYRSRPFKVYLNWIHCGINERRSYFLLFLVFFFFFSAHRSMISAKLIQKAGGSFDLGSAQVHYERWIFAYLWQYDFNWKFNETAWRHTSLCMVIGET